MLLLRRSLLDSHLTGLSLSTLHREYAALRSLPYYDFVNTILQPRLQNVALSNKQEIRKTMSDFNINEPQATAILKSMATNGFSLIQGYASRSLRLNKALM
jgi:senataxin